MTAMDSKKSQVNKKRKHWVYFARHGKKSASIQDAAVSTKPSGTDGTALPHKPGNYFIKAHMKKQKRKGKVPKLLEKMVSKDKDKQMGSGIQGSSASTISSEIPVKTAMKKIDDSENQHKIDRNNALKAKQQKKKRKRKLKILKRKEKEKGIKGSVTSESQVTLVTTGLTKKAKRTSGQANSQKTISATTDKELDREISKDGEKRLASDGKQESDEKRVSKKRKMKEELDTKRKKKKKTLEMGNSGMSSCTDEIPHLPEEPQDVASNWKALESKLKASAPTKPKLKAKNRNASDKAVDKETEIWFDDVDPALLEAEKEGLSEHDVGDRTQAPAGNKKITKCIALDCEMVGVGHEGKESILARVSMVNEYGQCIYDKFVKPREKVTDFRTEFSGVRPKDLFKGNAEEFLTVQKEVADIMKDRILVGHALKNDMKVLYLGHPRRLIRDTATYPHFRELMKTKRPALKKLAKTVLGVTVQEGEHNSVEDAQTAMRLYTLHRTAWEKSLKHRGKIIKK